MNKIQQIFGLDPEYNRKMEEQARQLHEKALAEKWCCTCEYYIPVDPNLPGFVTTFPECEYGGMAVETCSRYRVAAARFPLPQPTDTTLTSPFSKISAKKNTRPGVFFSFRSN